MVDWADHFESSEAEPVKPDQNDSSTLCNYSEDTFDSITNGSGSSRGYESEPFESYYSDEESDLRSGSETSSTPPHQDLVQATKDEQPEIIETEFLEKERIDRWIGILQNKKTDNRLSKAAIKPLAGASEEAADEGVDALQSFCFVKIRQICHSLKSQQQDGRRKKKLQPGLKSRKPGAKDLNCAAPSALVNLIYMKNIRETMKQVEEIKIHQPSKCLDCSAKKAELAKMDFLRRKKSAVETVLFQEKMEEQIYIKDSITLIGEIHRTLPKLSEDPQIIWQRLLKTTQQ